MEESMKFNSQICTTREQSQRPLDLGLKPETADMSHQYLEAEWDWFIFPCDWNHFTMSEDLIPAWSLHRLMDICSENYYTFNINVHKRDLYGFIISTFEHLKKQGKINKEYLKQ